ncbi:MAG: hypothetical protein ABI002_08875, partial [Saprospiraceae bacterium]
MVSKTEVKRQEEAAKLRAQHEAGEREKKKKNQANHQKFFEFLINVLGNVLPSIILLFSYWAFTLENENPSNLYSDGAFYLYAGSFLCSSAYILYRRKVKDRINWETYFIVALILLIFGVSGLYMGIITKELDNSILYPSSVA